MGFNYNYSIIQKISSINSGLLFAVSILNFNTITLHERDEYEINLQKLQDATIKALDCSIFRYSNNVLLILVDGDDLKDRIYQSLQEIIYKISLKYQGFTIGYSEINEDQVSNVINKALIANSIAIKKNRSVLSYEECLSEVKCIDETIKNLDIFYNAINKGEIYTVFQPIVDTSNEEIFFYESLLRINNQNNIINFISAAEKTDLIFSIDEQMLHNAIKTIQDSKVKISVNISVSSINNDEWVNKIFDFLKNSPSAVANLIIEIVGDNSFCEYKKILDFIFKFKAIGCKIAIDDFGTSFYLPFLKLEKLPIDFIKIDGESLEDGMKSKNTQIILEATVKIADVSNISIIAEYVVNEEMFNFFKQVNIKYMQGNYFYPADASILTL